jgi:hypothetical protein
MISLMLMTLLMTTSAQAAPGFSIALTDSNPDPGDALTIEVRWTNDSGETLHIPETWTDELEMLAVRVEPGEDPEPIRVVREMETSITEARSMNWLAVPAGESVRHELPIDIEACAEGCAGGSYYGQVGISWGMVDNLKPSQRLPQGQLPFAFDVTLATQPVTADAGVTAAITTVSPLDESGGLTVTVSLTNGTDATLWAAGAEHWLGACLLLHKQGENTGAADNAEPPGALVESTSQLMQPGDTMDIEVSCPGIAPEKVKKPEIMVSIKPAAPFFAIESHDNLRVFTGEISADAAPVPRK